MTNNQTTLQPVEDRTLRAQVCKQILTMVTSGQYSPGEKLTENSLASQLAVSRAPLREALRELVDKGILISQPYKGLYVRSVSERDLNELYSMRTALEKFAFTLAWPLRTDEALADLRNRYERLQSIHKSSDQALEIEYEISFHSWVYELTDHSILISHWQRLIPLVQIYLSIHHKQHGSQGKFGHMTTQYLKAASGDSIEEMMIHIDEHMKQGLSSVMKEVVK